MREIRVVYICEAVYEISDPTPINTFEQNEELEDKIFEDCKHIPEHWDIEDTIRIEEGSH